ncbi:hypothetical protein PV08_06697 [Exophiala spinifera]|uniref:Uncharacterized protein n=1 Tax=Exophiala spinifera TaxID=91928 RepID=A0A0D1YFV2_9EURO|nr:uncharacterized protein PV08_06697 [Exophiala spinifera]KIW13916.1 hypothetical protein PV08_06697 [Exophiala spinifera]
MESTSTTVTLILLATVGMVTGVVIVGFHIRKCYHERHRQQIHAHARTDPLGDWYQGILEAELEAGGRVWSTGASAAAVAASTTAVTEPPPAYSTVAPQRDSDRDHGHEHERTESTPRATYNSNGYSSARTSVIRPNTMTTALDVNIDFDINFDLEIAEPPRAHIPLPPPYSRDDSHEERLPPYRSLVSNADTGRTSVHRSPSAFRQARRTARAQRVRDHAGAVIEGAAAGDGHRRVAVGVCGRHCPSRHSSSWRRQRNHRSMLDNIELGRPYVHRAYTEIESRWSWSSSSSSSLST